MYSSRIIAIAGINWLHLILASLAYFSLFRLSVIHVIKCAGVKDEDIAEKSFITIQYL